MKTWKQFIQNEMEKPYFSDLNSFLKQEYKHKKIYPPKKNIFTAFDLCELESTKVVILGMDPYHQPNQAHGLAFSVNKEIKIPPSLRNIFKELRDDLGIETSSHGDLTAWASQGVLLLNSILTVKEGAPASHAKSGWQTFTDNAISLLNSERKNLVFILWGAFARSKKMLITNNHLILESVHPSPLSAYDGFFGSKPFSKTNEYLISKNVDPIDWKIR